MSFSLTSSTVSLSGGILKASCLAIDGSTKSSSLDLDQYIGNKNGSFDLTSKNFSRSAHDCVYDKGTIEGSLRSFDGTLTTASLCLDMYVTNVDGRLVFSKGKLTEFIPKSCGAFTLGDSVLHALCLGHDGKFHHSSIDLNNHYGNRSGSFTSKGDRYFDSARNLTLIVTSAEVLLCADLRIDGDEYVHSEIDVATCISNQNGALVFERHGNQFDHSGEMKVPLVGVAVAGVHALTSNPACNFLLFYPLQLDRHQLLIEDVLHRENISGNSVLIAVQCAISSILAVGIAIGCLFGGPVGGAITAAMGTPLIVAEGTLREYSFIGDENSELYRDFKEMTFGRIFFEALRNVSVPNTAPYIAELLGSSEFVSEESIAAITECLSGHSGKHIAWLSDIALYSLLRRIADALQGPHAKAGLVQRWGEIEERMRNYRPQDPVQDM